jgi:hypothetical protein
MWWPILFLKIISASVFNKGRLVFSGGILIVSKIRPVANFRVKKSF